jgi:cytochrome c biogenesis protein CcmG/thiol:disulfide interchange protein DsbE
MAKRQLTRPRPAKEKRRTRSRWITWTVVGGLAVVIAGSAAYFAMQAPAEKARTGSPAPEFTLALLNGQTVALSSLRGRPVLVNFWHST